MVSHWGHAVGYDWDLPSTSYSYQIHFIHIKGVWHALYVVGGHKGATPYPTITLQGQFGEERVLVCIIHCYVMIGTSPTSYLYQIHFIHIKGG